MKDARVGRAVELYKSILDLAAMEKRAEAGSEEERPRFQFQDNRRNVSVDKIDYG